MDSYNQRTGFRYNPSSTSMEDPDTESEFSGVLEIFVHNARNIHNICIYDNQDVYAKFSLTCNPDETLSTRIINGGGKNPDFNENLRMKISQIDAVLKCEIWMLSRARNYMEDQLLGFALIPISEFVEKGKVTRDYSLSSTDLFHSPAGTIQLSLSLNTSKPIDLQSFPSFPKSILPSSSIASEVVLLDRKSPEVVSDPVDYSRLEFLDMEMVRENQQMVSQYFNLTSSGSKPGFLALLRLGSSSPSSSHHDCEMINNSSEDNNNNNHNRVIRVGSVSPNESVQNSGFMSSTTTSLSDDRNSADSGEKKSFFHGESSSLSPNTDTKNNNGSANIAINSPETPTSKKGTEKSEKKDKIQNQMSKEDGGSNRKVFSSPISGIEAEQSAMQKQIVDMYMKSMQQFTESLAKMKLPTMEIDNKSDDGEDGCDDVIQTHNKNLEIDQKNKKKDGSRVFYGSRAFF